MRITFVPRSAGFMHLAVVLDAWSHKVVGWSNTNHLRAELVVDALEAALGQRWPEQHPIEPIRFGRMLLCYQDFRALLPSRLAREVL